MTTDTFNVWVSSIRHLDEFTDLAKANYGAKSIFKSKIIPSGFPYVKLWFSRYPLVFFSTGILKLSDTKVEYNASKKYPGFNYRNLANDYHFDVVYSEIDVEWYSHPSPYMKAFNIAWIKISINESSQDSILLSCTGTGFTIKQMKRKNQLLFERLISVTNPNTS